MDIDTYHVTCEQRPHYLYVKIEAPEERLDTALKVWAAIAQECSRLGMRRMLVDENVGTQLSAGEIFQFATQMPELGFWQIKLAVVDRQPDHDTENRFGQTVATNRGVTVRVCDDLDEAESWLLDA